MEDELVTESADSNSSTNTVRTTKRTRNDRLVSGKFKGVVPQQNGHWGAQIYTKHKRIWLGTFKSETEAAMAYDSAAIKLRSGDSSRNFPWTNVTLEEPDFQAQYSTETVLNMLKDGSYQSKFADFLRNRSQSAEDEVGSSLAKGDAGGGRLFCKQLFQKELTPSDVGKLNRLVIPKKYAVKYFPPILESADENADGSGAEDIQLVFYDKLMRLWKFRYCYWRSSQSFVFTRGWNRFVKEKELKAHETITFFLCKHRGAEQKQKFCMIDVERDQINGGSNQNAGMHVELQLALRSSSKKLEEEDQVVVEVEPLELQLALRPSVVDDDEAEEDPTDKNAETHFELQLALRPSIVCDKEEEVEPRDGDVEGFKLFGVQIKRQCCREVSQFF